MFQTLSPLKIKPRQDPIQGHQLQGLADRIEQVSVRVSEVIWDKESAVKLLLAGIFSGGHILLEDTPGVGKTTLAQALAVVLGLQFKRIQFTSDLLPGDITGGAIFDRDTGSFHFQPGPVFAQVLLADEINRASPKAQSALLEAMEERRVTVDGISHNLPAPFLVIATQNPAHHSGTHALPESQLDRFLLIMGLGYPSARAEMAMMMGGNPREKLPALKPVLDLHEFEAIAVRAKSVHVGQALADYVHRIAVATRDESAFSVGLSPRSLMGLVRAAQAHALMNARDHVIPQDVKAIYPWVAAHRLTPLNEPGVIPGPASAEFHRDWLQSIPSEA